MVKFVGTSLFARWLITPQSLDGVLFWLICIVSSVQYFLIDNYAALARNLLSNPLVLISFLQDCVTSGQPESDMNKTFLKYEYHVIYSTSYGVPVLYFTASRQGNCDIFWCFIFLMVIELSGVQFGLKSYAWFQNWMSAQRKFNLKSKVSDFGPKLHNMRFNYHFITSILKLPKYRTWSVQLFYWCSTEPVWN